MKRIISYLFGLMVLVSCATVPTSTKLMEESEAIQDVTAEEIGLRMTEFAFIFSGVVEVYANEIIDRAEESEIRKNALSWKIYSIPAAHKAIFLSDPFAGFIDTWALCIQMKNYFKSGNGKNNFGKYQPIAVEASEFLESELLAIASQVIKRDSLMRSSSDINSWAEENPLNNQYFVRRSTIELTARVIGSQKWDIGSSVGSIAENVEALKSMVNMYADFLPKHGRWQAEYLMTDLSLDYFTDSLSTDVKSISGSLERIALLTDELRFSIDSLLSVTFAEINRQRIETINLLIDQVDLSKRLIEKEREILLAEINRQRIETLVEIRQISDNTLKDASEIIKDSIDHLMIRIIEMFALFGLLLFLGYLTMRRIKRG